MIIKRLPNLNIEPLKGRAFGWQLKQMRNECGLSQLELAEAVGYETAVAIHLLETEKRKVSVYKLWQICCVCGYELSITPLKDN